jgi:hypothetical protein
MSCQNQHNGKGGEWDMINYSSTTNSLGENKLIMGFSRHEQLCEKFPNQNSGILNVHIYFGKKKAI